MNVEDPDYIKTFMHVASNVVRGSYNSALSPREHLDALSYNQSWSKYHMRSSVRRMANVLGLSSVRVCYQACWLGSGPLWLDTAPEIDFILAVDRNSRCIDTLEHVTLNAPKIVAWTEDVLSEHSLRDVLANEIDLIVNTSIEHFQPDALSRYLKRYANVATMKGLYLQATNMPAEDHLWMPRDLQEFTSWVQETFVDVPCELLTDAIPLEDPDHQRFEATVLLKKEE